MKFCCPPAERSRRRRGLSERRAFISPVTSAAECKDVQMRVCSGRLPPPAALRREELIPVPMIINYSTFLWFYCCCSMENIHDNQVFVLSSSFYNSTPSFRETSELGSEFCELKAVWLWMFLQVCPGALLTERPQQAHSQLLRVYRHKRDMNTPQEAPIGSESCPSEGEEAGCGLKPANQEVYTRSCER